MAKTRFYRENDGSFLAISAGEHSFISNSGERRIMVVCTAISKNPYQLIHEEISTEYLHCKSRRVAAENVPIEWRRRLEALV